MGYKENVAEEFATIDLLLPSDTTTGRTDAFILAYTKLDKQIRKVFTYLVYQFDGFSSSSNIIDVIAADSRLYPRNFIKGFDSLYNRSFEDILGEKYIDFRDNELERISGYRNKILHGQVTGQRLSADDLTQEVTLIREIVELIAEKMSEEIGFDGLGRNSLRKSDTANFTDRFKVEISNNADLENFINNVMKAK